MDYSGVGPTTLGISDPLEFPQRSSEGRCLAAWTHLSAIHSQYPITFERCARRVAGRFVVYYGGILPSARWVLMKLCVLCRCPSTCFVSIKQIELMTGVSNSAMKICG